MAGRVNWYRDVFCDYGAEILLVGMGPTPMAPGGETEDGQGRGRAG